MAIFEYSGGTYDLPASIYNYPNLHITGSGTKTAGATDLLVNGNLYVDNATFNVSSDVSAGDVIVLGNLIINTGSLVMPNSGVSRTLDIAGDMTFTGAGSFNIATGGSSLSHQINLEGNITQGTGNIDFNETSNATISFTGENSAVVSKTGTGTTEFYKIEIDKPEGQKVEFTGDFDLKGPTDDATKALTLTSGECHLNNADIAISLSTGGKDFRIPAGTTLRVDNGALVKVGGDEATGIWLDGSLIVDNGGKVNCNTGTNGNTYIEYTSSGNSTIWLGEATRLNVGSQIRRSLNTDEGILNFVQSASNTVVRVGLSNEGDASRGMFEVLGSSSFTQSEGAKMTIVRGHDKDHATLYFDPETVSLGAGSSFVFGNENTLENQNMAIYAGVPLKNIVISSTNSPKVSLRVLPLVLDEDLRINSGAEFDAQGLDVTINGDLICVGTYTPNNNTTYFEGETSQKISGTPTFYNFVKQNGSSDMFLTGSITVENKLDLSSGTFDTRTDSVMANGDVNNDIAVSSNSGSGIVLDGTYTQQIGGSGSYDIFTVNNTSGVVVPTQSGALTINDTLRMENGVFDIGRNLLVLGSDAAIEPVNPYSVDNMVQTNLSFTDNGIKKYFPQITSATTFTYPIGSLGKYTPVVLDISNNGNSTGAIRVKAANEPHITVPVADQGNVLQYYWTLDAEGIEGFSADARMYSYRDDAIPVSDTVNYYTAKLLLGTTQWEKFGTDNFHGGASIDNYLYFGIGKPVGTDDLGIDGDYTAGAAIPENVPTYITVADSSWTTTTTWATYDPSTGATGIPGENVPEGGPRGSIIYVNDTLTMPSNGMSAYRTVINASGTIETGSTFAHRLGDVSGTGTLALESGDMPAGVYDEFFSEDGGTLEFTGTSLDYDVLSEITQVNNLKFSGTGTRNFPNLDVQLLGDLTIDGPDVVNLYDKKLSVKGDVDFASGTYNARSGSLLFNGSSLQTVDGAVDFKSGSGGALYDLEINNSSNVDIKNDIEVTNSLTLTEGVLNTKVGGSLTITNTLPSAVTGGKNTSYVEGPLRKAINNSDYFVFPVGDAQRYGEIRADVDGSSGGIWEAQYYNHSPGNDGMDPASIDASGNLKYVSHGEYWRVEAPSSGNAANLTMRWDANSGVNPNGDFTVARWTDLATDAWSEVSTGTVSGTTSSGTTNLASNLTFGFNGSDNNHYITFGTITVPSFTWIGNSSDWFTASNWTNSILPDASSDVTINTVTAPSVYPVIDNSGIVQVNSLTISSGATLTLQPGAKMTVNGNLATNDGLIVKNTVDAPTSLINMGAVIGDVTVEWIYPEGQYWYIGHCVDGATYDDYVNAGSFNLYKYTGSAWSQITTDYNFDNNPVEGYAFKNTTTGEDTVSHTGTLRTSSYSATINGWNLIANPYPCYIDVENAGFDRGNTLSTIWTTTNREAGGTQYATYNLDLNTGALNGTRYIAPGQLFWLRNYEAGTFNIAPTVRTHAPSSLTQEELQLKGAKVTESDVLRLTLNNEDKYDEVVFVFRSIGNASEATNYDSEKRMGKTVEVPNIYAVKRDTKIVIGAYPEEMGETDTIYLGYKFDKEQEITLKATNLNEFKLFENIYLFDKATGTVVNLRDNPEYTFMSSAGEDAGRFKIYFTKTDVATGIKDNENSANGDVWIYGYEDNAVVKVSGEILSGAEGKGTIRVYNVSGKLIKEVKLTDVKTTIGLPGNHGVYIITVNTGNTVRTGKVTLM